MGVEESSDKSLGDLLNYPPMSFIMNLVNEVRQETLLIQAAAEAIQSNQASETTKPDVNLEERSKFTLDILDRASNLNSLLDVALSYVAHHSNGDGIDKKG
jgi:hypothetical protein